MTCSFVEYFLPRPLRLVFFGGSAASTFVASLLSAVQLIQVRVRASRGRPRMAGGGCFARPPPLLVLPPPVGVHETASRPDRSPVRPATPAATCPGGAAGRRRAESGGQPHRLCRVHGAVPVRPAGSGEARGTQARGACPGHTGSAVCLQRRCSPPASCWRGHWPAPGFLGEWVFLSTPIVAGRTRSPRQHGAGRRRATAREQAACTRLPDQQ
jgi:hypothetical protein